MGFSMVTTWVRLVLEPGSVKKNKRKISFDQFKIIEKKG